MDIDLIQPTTNCASEHLPRSESLILTMNISVVLMIAFCVLYLPVIFMIWKERNKQAVYFKSPMMILIAGFSLLGDSLVNIIINTNDIWGTEEYQYQGICSISIMDTLTFHYIAYFAIIFRGRRIFKVMNLTAKYLDKIYGMA